MFANTLRLVNQRDWRALHRSFRHLSSTDAVPVLHAVAECIEATVPHLDRYSARMPVDAVTAGVWLKALARLKEEDIDYSETDTALKALGIAERIAKNRGDCIHVHMPELLERIRRSASYAIGGSESPVARKMVHIADAVMRNPHSDVKTQAEFLRFKLAVQSDLKRFENR